MKSLCLLQLSMVMAINSFSQSIRLKDFESIFDRYDFSKNGFTISIDTIFEGFKITVYRKRVTGEIIELKTAAKKDISKITSAGYYIKSRKAYYRFLAELKSSNFRYFPEKQKYSLKTSSYSWRYFLDKGQILENGAKYYKLEYENVEGKELSETEFIE